MIKYTPLVRRLSSPIKNANKWPRLMIATQPDERHGFGAVKHHEAQIQRHEILRMKSQNAHAVSRRIPKNAAWPKLTNPPQPSAMFSPTCRKRQNGRAGGERNRKRLIPAAARSAARPASLPEAQRSDSSRGIHARAPIRPGGAEDQKQGSSANIDRHIGQGCAQRHGRGRVQKQTEQHGQEQRCHSVWVRPTKIAPTTRPLDGPEYRRSRWSQRPKGGISTGSPIAHLH